MCAIRISAAEFYTCRLDTVFGTPCYENMTSSVNPWFYIFFFTINKLLSLLSILWFYGYNIFMALNSLLCANVPLRNCSINQSIRKPRSI